MAIYYKIVNEQTGKTTKISCRAFLNSMAIIKTRNEKLYNYLKNAYEFLENENLNEEI